MQWPGRMFAPQGFQTFDLSAIQRSGHMGLMKVLASPHVDFLSSPYDYAWRSVGGEGAFMSLTSTIHRHGKVYLLEDDSRTYLHPDERYGKVDTALDSVAVLQRNFCNYLTGNAGFWWMEQGRDFSWFDDPLILDCQGKINGIAQRSLGRDRSPSGEIAVVFDEESLFHHTYRKDLMYPLIYKFKLFGLPRLGAPVRFYHFDDLADDDFPKHKLYIFLDLFYVTPERIEQVHRCLRRDGAMALWFYGAGLQSPKGISTDTMEQLTGIHFGMDDIKWELTCVITDWDHPITTGLPADLSFGTDNLQRGPQPARPGGEGTRRLVKRLRGRPQSACIAVARNSPPCRSAHLLGRWGHPVCGPQLPGRPLHTGRPAHVQFATSFGRVGRFPGP